MRDCQQGRSLFTMHCDGLHHPHLLLLPKKVLLLCTQLSLVAQLFLKLAVQCWCLRLQQQLSQNRTANIVSSSHVMRL